MEEKLYLEKLSMMRIRHREEMRELQREYAMAQSPFKVGDLVTDHIGTVKVDYIDFDVADMGRRVRCVYVGPCYTKQGKPFKSGERRPVFQQNILKMPV